MKNIKNIRLFYLIHVWAVLSCILVKTTYSAGFDFSEELNDPITDAFISNTEFQTKKDADPGDILNLLVFTFHAPCLLENNLYIHTYPLNKKSIIDVPAFFPYRDYSRKSTFGMSFFLNQTWRMFFSENCDGIQSYLAVCNPNLLQRLSQCADCAKDLYPQYAINPLVIFPLYGSRFLNSPLN